MPAGGNQVRALNDHPERGIRKAREILIQLSSHLRFTGVEYP